jgi:type II secretory pathway pseudopilin PulG
MRMGFTLMECIGVSVISSALMAIAVSRFINTSADARTAIVIVNYLTSRQYLMINETGDVYPV